MPVSVEPRPHDVGHVASAYNRVDDIAWLVTQDLIRPGEDYSAHLLEISAAIYVVGKIAGYSDDELRDRLVPVDEVRALIAANEGRAIASRRASRRLPWRSS